MMIAEVHFWDGLGRSSLREKGLKHGPSTRSSRESMIKTIYEVNIITCMSEHGLGVQLSEAFPI